MIQIRKPYPIDALVMKSIVARRTALAFSAKDFFHLGSPVAVRKALERLTRKGELRRIRRGYYDRPRSHPILGVTAPDPIDLIRGMMSHSGARWQVSGAYAANLLHLTDQVPAKIVVLTDAPPRKVNLGKLVLDFRRASPRNLLGAGTPAGLVIQALRHLGKANVSSDVLGRLQAELDQTTKNALKDLSPRAPAWMHPYLAQLAN